MKKTEQIQRQDEALAFLFQTIRSYDEDSFREIQQLARRTRTTNAFVEKVLAKKLLDKEHHLSGVGGGGGGSEADDLDTADADDSLGEDYDGDTYGSPGDRTDDALDSQNISVDMTPASQVMAGTDHPTSSERNEIWYRASHGLPPQGMSGSGAPYVYQTGFAQDHARFANPQPQNAPQESAMLPVSTSAPLFEMGLPETQDWTMLTAPTPIFDQLSMTNYEGYPINPSASVFPGFCFQGSIPTLNGLDQRMDEHLTLRNR